MAATSRPRWTASRSPWSPGRARSTLSTRRALRCAARAGREGRWRSAGRCCGGERSPRASAVARRNGRGWHRLRERERRVCAAAALRGRPDAASERVFAAAR
eukprot:5152288-Prymnesium_polylepis.2